MDSQRSVSWSRQPAFAWVVIIAGALIFHAPAALFNVGLPVKDFLVHYRWAVEFSDALSGGDLYPRWMGRAYHGLGEPALLYYSPLFYYCTALVRFATSNTWTAMRIVFVISTVITGRYGYLIVERYADRRFALLGAFCLQMTPMIQMLFNYVSEIPWAASFPALIALIYYATRPGALEKLIDIPVSVCVALLVCTHILSAFMVLICFTGYFLTYLRIDGGRVTLGKPPISWAASVTFGLLLSSIYLVPALTSMSYISSNVWTTNYTPWSAFSFPTVTAMMYGIRWFSFQWPVSGTLLLLVAAATWIAARRPNRSDALGSMLFFLLTVSWIALFLASEFSFPLWILHTPLRMLQFSHRFIYIASASGTLANLLVVSERLKHHAVTMRQRIPLVFPLLLAIALTAALEAKFITVDARPLNLTPDDRSLYGGLAEYKPRNAGTGEKAYENGGYAADCRREGLICGRPVETGDRVDFHIVSPAAEVTRLPIFAFPAWTATLNGTPVGLRTDAGTGAVSLLLLKGQDNVSLVWRRLPQERAGMFLSLLSGLTMIFLAGRRGKRLLQF